MVGQCGELKVYVFIEGEGILTHFFFKSGICFNLLFQDDTDEKLFCYTISLQFSKIPGTKSKIKFTGFLHFCKCRNDKYQKHTYKLSFQIGEDQHGLDRIIKVISGSKVKSSFQATRRFQRLVTLTYILYGKKRYFIWRDELIL